jgi:hypothetical protein
MLKRRFWMVLGAVALLGMGFCGGMFFSRPGHPVMMQIASRMNCASSRQFVVEFRVLDGQGKRIVGDELRDSAELDVDGERVGILSRSDEQAVRRFLCEGNHIAQFTIENFQPAHPEVHRVVFAVSRPSLFHAKQWSEYVGRPSISCVSDKGCGRSIYLELSPYVPDDPKVRIFPSEP